MGDNCDYFDTLDDALQYVRQVEESTANRFVVSKLMREGTVILTDFSFFNDICIYIAFNKKRVFFENPWKTGISKSYLEFDGIPFIVKRSNVLACQLGKYYNKSGHYERKTDRIIDRSVRTRPTIKQGCPATVCIQEVIKFPKFWITSNTKSRRMKSSQRLKAALRDAKGRDIGEHRFYVVFRNEHKHTDEEASRLTSKICPEVKAFIRKQVNEGVVTVAELKHNTTQYISNTLHAGKTLPTQFNRRFLVTREDYIKLFLSQRSRQVKSRCDCERVIEKMSSWQAMHADDRFWFRPYAEHCSTVKAVVDCDRIIVDGSGELGFLFIYQTTWQQRLLRIYGGLCLLEPAYRTAKYPVPVYLLYVRTNAEYVVVATVVVQYEDDGAIAEALRVLREWNHDWKPWSFMVDFSDADVKAVKIVFPECEVYISDYHRERCWNSWISLADEGIRSVRHEVLSRLHSLSHSSAVYQFLAIKAQVMKTHVWKSNSSLQKWFSTTQLEKAELWARAYRSPRFQVMVKTNCGVERLEKVMRRVKGELSSRHTYSVSAFLTFLVEKFLPEEYKEYIDANVRYQEINRDYCETLPAFLKNRPSDLVRHLFERLLANESIDENGVLLFGANTFSVIVPFSIIAFRVEFGNSAKEMPKCNCDEWEQYYWPCRHFCAVFQRTKHVWNELAEPYRDCPYFVIDEEVVVSGANELIPAESIPEFQAVGSYVTISRDDHLEGQLEVEESHEPFGIRCREVLRSITDMTFACADVSALRSLLNSLNTAHAEFTAAIASCRGVDEPIIIQEDSICEPPSERKRKKRYRYPKKKKKKMVDGEVESVSAAVALSAVEVRHGS